MLNLRYLSVIGIALLVGCSEQPLSQPPSGVQTSDSWKEALDGDIVTALSQLSDADRTAALAQNVCPVTDKPLGSMGKPPKFTIEGKDVYLCCGGCEEVLLKEPSKYLAKLKAK